jgi:hypothetical protein
MEICCFRLVTELVEKDEAYRLSEDIDSVDPSKLSCELLGLELAAMLWKQCLWTSGIYNEII